MSDYKYKLKMDKYIWNGAEKSKYPGTSSERKPELVKSSGENAKYPKNQEIRKKIP